MAPQEVLAVVANGLCEGTKEEKKKTINFSLPIYFCRFVANNLLFLLFLSVDCFCFLNFRCLLLLLLGGCCRFCHDKLIVAVFCYCLFVFNNMLSLFLFLLVDFVVAFLSPLSAVAAVVATGWLLSLLPLLVDCCCFCYCRFVQGSIINRGYATWPLCLNKAQNSPKPCAGVLWH